MPDTPVLLDDIPSPNKPNPCWEHARANPGRWVETDLSVASVGKLRRRYSDEGFEIAPRTRTVYVRYNRPAAR